MNCSFKLSCWLLRREFGRPNAERLRVVAFSLEAVPNAVPTLLY